MKINWRYAIGEIIIVIIGISIAFYLNSWKENRQNNLLKEQYLENLVKDIEEETAQLNQNNQAIQRKVGLINTVVPTLGPGRPKPDSIVQKVFELANLVSFNPENTTYQTLVNSGDMKLINNLDLRRQIEAHYSLHSDILKNYERIEQIHQKYMGDFFIYEIDFEKLYQGDQSFLDKPILKNILNSSRGAYYLILEANKKGISSNEKLHQSIQEKITK